MYRKEVKANLQVYHGLLDRDPRARVKAWLRSLGTEIKA